ncbi:ubiquitin-like superfamily protein [Tasmannia lanceolata]|uniref:ubiquitin-like superfamily protein n=1 Tax=Tasmannia lanceolata TaxID=3420 RepID=UPI004064C2B9
MDVSTEEQELEPLFDYSRIQPIDFISIDDDSLDSSPIFDSKRKRIPIPIPNPSEEKGEKNCEIVNVEKEEEDWLPPPPKRPTGGFESDSTLKELRLKKQELASFAQSAEDVLREVEESVKRELSSSGQHSEVSEVDKPSTPHDKREKIIISIQDKDGVKQFRVYTDEKFQRLFKMYAEKVKANLESLVFSFDGDKVSPNATPQSLGLENEDIIEVRLKSA